MHASGALGSRRHLSHILDLEDDGITRVFPPTPAQRVGAFKAALDGGLGHLSRAQRLGPGNVGEGKTRT